MSDNLTLIAMRDRAGLSQTALAKAMGVSQSKVSKLESRDIRDVPLRALVDYAWCCGFELNFKVVKKEARP